MGDDVEGRHIGRQAIKLAKEWGATRIYPRSWAEAILRGGDELP
jgi:hypothetical protein